jgi:hypothetical protein
MTLSHLHWQMPAGGYRAAGAAGRPVGLRKDRGADASVSYKARLSGELTIKSRSLPVTT